MPQPKSRTTTSRSTGTAGAKKSTASAKKPAAAKASSASGRTPAAAAAKKTTAAAKKPAAAAKKPAAAAKKPAGAAKKPAAKRSTARKPAGAAAKASSARSRGSRSVAARDEALKTNLAQLRELLSSGVVLTAERIQDAVEETVRNGHMTRQAAEDLTRNLVEIGRRQTQELLSGVETIVDKSGSAAASARDQVATAGRRARSGAVARSDRALKEVDRARRAAKVGPSFPISLYDELKASQIVSRLADLTPAQLRKVRTHEEKTANRKSVIGAIDKRLAK